MRIDCELNRSLFGYRGEEGQHMDGCGIICEDFLIDILGKKATQGRGLFSFRIEIPRDGVYKGMVTKRKNLSSSLQQKLVLLPPCLYPLDHVHDSEKMTFSIEVS
mmetsp:Transcript_10933/g.16819  ORF Transcript_10933/g.16819 Transcript_10933/m.16819 type:complete len:105 (-) Transcript_10933:390-704(-)